MNKRLLLLPALILASSLHAMDALVKPIEDAEETLPTSAGTSEGGLRLTPLHLASLGGHLGEVKYRIEEQGAQVDVKDKYGSTPLHLASSMGHLELVKYLTAEQGAQVDVQANDGLTPLYWAFLKGHLELVKYLIVEQKAQVDAQGKNGCTPLHLTCVRGFGLGQLEVVRYLIERGARQDLQDNSGRTPMDMAINSGNHKLLKLL